MGDFVPELAVNIHSHSNVNGDSIEIGTAGKGGVVKIYGDFDRPEEFKKRIDNAAEIRKYANIKLALKNGGE